MFRAGSNDKEEVRLWKDLPVDDSCMPACRPAGRLPANFVPAYRPRW